MHVKKRPPSGITGGGKQIMLAVAGDLARVTQLGLEGCRCLVIEEGDGGTLIE